jgi:MFS family permease
MVGAISSPLIGAYILDNYGWNAVFYAIVLASVLAMLFSLFLTETIEKTPRTEANPDSSKKKSKTRFDASYRYILAIFFLLNLFISGEMALHQITPFYLKEKFNVNNFQQGLFYIIGTLFPKLIFMLPAGWLADKYSRRNIIFVSIITWQLTIVLWPYIGSYEILLMLSILLQSCAIISQPAIQAYLMDFTDASRRGETSGVFGLGHHLGGGVIGTALIGYIYEVYNSTMSFYTLALFVLPSIPLLLLLKKPKEHLTVSS